jgi:hypothetical protein
MGQNEKSLENEIWAGFGLNFHNISLDLAVLVEI